MRTAIALAASVALLCACGPPPQNGGLEAGVELRVEPLEAQPGGGVELVLSNGSTGEIGYNLCTSALERQTGGDWTPVATDRVCTMELRTLPSGEVARYPYDLPADLRPGEYRFMTSIERMETGGRDAVVSDVFQVNGGRSDAAAG